jgi:dynamin-binding protein
MHRRKTSGGSHARQSSRGTMVVLPPVPPPEIFEKELKRLRMRYKVINEILQTELTFLGDMRVVEECYHAMCHECPTISQRQKQTIFGRVKSIIEFGNKFYSDLNGAAGQYATKPQDEIMGAKFDVWLQWDEQTSVGDVFWSSMVRIEKAYMGYCTHQEEASQMIMELEKNELVKAWLEVRSHLTMLTQCRNANDGAQTELVHGISTLF